MGRNKIVTSLKSGSTDYDIYVNTVNSKEISEAVLISENVISVEAEGNNLYYIKSEGDKTDLYVFTPENGSALVCENNLQFIAINPGEAVAFKTVDEDIEILLYKNGETETVDSGIDPKYFAVDSGSFAYIKDYQSAAATDEYAQKGGELKLYSDSKLKTVDTGVTQIFLIRK